MTPLQRRYYLLGIFYCRTPESRERRISQMLEDSLARLERIAKKQVPPVLRA